MHAIHASERGNLSDLKHLIQNLSQLDCKAHLSASSNTQNSTVSRHMPCTSFKWCSSHPAQSTTCRVAFLTWPSVEQRASDMFTGCISCLKHITIRLAALLQYRMFQRSDGLQHVFRGCRFDPQEDHVMMCNLMLMMEDFVHNTYFCQYSRSGLLIKQTQYPN